MLTTISLAPSCLTETWLSSSVGATTQPGVVLGKPHDPNCWPGNRDLTTTISPAICPYGYTSACDIVDASRRDDTETVWACCPSHFWCDGGIFSCVKSLVEGSTNTYTAIDTDIFGNTITTQIMKTDGINAHSIRVAFHSSDILDHLSPTSGPSLSNPTPARTLTSPFPTASSEPAPTAPNPEVWPAGAWVGIGVGVTIGAIILLSSVVWIDTNLHFIFHLLSTPIIVISHFSKMKVLITGASGSIGGECLTQCLSNPDISTVVAFVRRDLPAEISSHPKLKCVLIKDFSQWPEDVLQAHADAAGIIWAMGSYKGSRTADLEYPLAFLESMARVLETKPTRSQFRYVHLGGMFTCHDQEKKLWFLEYPRKIRGLGEAKALEFGDSHDDTWRIFIARPGGVATREMMGSRTIASILGENWCVRIEELGAFMAYLAIHGEGESSVIENMGDERVDEV
ncbi:hypothetical protein E0Z10_g6032 [Xylaria hypoxylon]|uniref:NAD(P)-binding domain-containing protein n=1 Tax=Xylaria hypoxylon TaxID=37992 RepID=A0A4Z0YEP4_9PEZI|nr:hypothetical protein E0Z10_g6032 [Xylaria hypoxylon]